MCLAGGSFSGECFGVCLWRPLSGVGVRCWACLASCFGDMLFGVSSVCGREVYGFVLGDVVGGCLWTCLWGFPFGSLLLVAWISLPSHVVSAFGVLASGAHCRMLLFKRFYSKSGGQWRIGLRAAEAEPVTYSAPLRKGSEK